jgi:hypothetical protein
VIYPFALPRRLPRGWTLFSCTFSCSFSSHGVKLMSPNDVWRPQPCHRNRLQQEALVKLVIPYVTPKNRFNRDRLLEIVVTHAKARRRYQFRGSSPEYSRESRLPHQIQRLSRSQVSRIFPQTALANTVFVWPRASELVICSIFNGALSLFVTVAGCEGLVALRRMRLCDPSSLRSACPERPE